MGWYTSSKFAFDSIRKLTSKLVPKNPFPKSIQKPTNHFPSTPTLNNNPKNSTFSLSSPSISKTFGFQFCPKHPQYSHSIHVAKRFYYVDRNQIRHFRPRGHQRWFRNPRNVFIVIVLSSGVVITLYFGNLETVPYTKRKHFVILSESLEKQLGDTQFKQTKDGFKSKILPAIHPDSIRVRLIAKEIIEALERGLRKDQQVWRDDLYSAESVGMSENSGEEGSLAISEGNEGKWNKEDEILNDKWVQESRKKGREKGSTGHLERWNWEVLVVNEPDVNAFCLPGGKIVVFTGLLKYFTSDAEIATVIGHEVGHAVARHVAEGITKNLWFAIIQLILYQFATPDIVNTMSSLFLRLPFSRRMEMEADYIGLLLLASAGYDPRVAPKVYETLGEITGQKSSVDYLSTHPSGKKRAQLLARAHVMEEALAIYWEVSAGRGVEGFL